ncbi:hypothetical protein K470DRAFT_208573 [Piedraia hortae CBS 480.64]|uniref:Ribosomal protein S21 n=1 Tax=Piedraia hortae CBS 480.64 TaxID=1314780 RepID=A0A6A7CBU4_9PEZI|nr:hypothetical protein K470DRAFT_208573 [Piedraia hortae CBS 480.64]
MLNSFSAGGETSKPSLPALIEKPLPMKLNASVGRTVYVRPDKSMDLARSFRALEVKCAQNKVRKEARTQKFHERPGLKRKRLKSERWRARFKENFRSTVQMVQKLRGQGW